MREPAPNAARFAVLHVPAAFDEMNKARRTVALAARALAGIGGRVALLDPRGTGDSEGDHRDATWDAWCEDVRFAWEWLGRQGPQPRIIWGTRLGGLLATQLATHAQIEPRALLLWQPVSSGATFFHQFLRVAAAQQFNERERDAIDAKAVRAELASGHVVEVAGYDLHPGLVSRAQEIDMAALPMPACPVIWRESSALDPPSLSAASERVRARWADNGVRLDMTTVSGPSFWATQEISEGTVLVESTLNAIVGWLSSSGATR